jgi:hypothetical protein
VKTTQNSKYSSKLFQAKFYAMTFSGNLCQKAFLGMQVKRCRVESVVKRFVETGGRPVEGRGGDYVSKKYEEIRDSVIKFIKKFQCIEAHYCRSASSVRMCLSSSLSINKTYHMYNEESPVELRVK